MAWIDNENTTAKKFKNGDKALTARELSCNIGCFEQFTLVTIEKGEIGYIIKDDYGNEITKVFDKDLIPNTEEDKKAVLKRENIEFLKPILLMIAFTIIFIIYLFLISFFYGKAYETFPHC